ncbi:hypothetical protein RB195_017858 [Necator americanus]|uniref:Inner centromere protein ARK-binding domain-containing protein n=1 Tax=Necator americanus TaxID=51031 RepID=A0ABR1C759_NECAM
MPPKRTRKKSKALTEVKESDGEDCDDLADSARSLLNHIILTHPKLRIKEIIERGSAATIADLSANFSNASDWLHAQKAALKEMMTEAGAPSRAVPKTPRRGVAFARFRETVEMYISRSLILEEQSSDRMGREDEVQLTTTTQDEPSCEESDGESSYEDAVGGIPMSSEDTVPMRVASAGSHSIGDSVPTSETYVSASENPDRLPEPQHPVHIKVECVTPPTYSCEQPILSIPNVEVPSVTNVVTKQEILSSTRERAGRSVANTLVDESSKRVLRSAARMKVGTSSTSVAKPCDDEAFPSLSRSHQKDVPTAAFPEAEVRAAAGASHTRLPRVIHQHIVTTPCRREFKSAVQRVMDDQEIARALSPKRAVVRTPRSKGNVKTSSHAESINMAAKMKAEASRKEKEQQAAYLREEQCRERAERIRKEREEKALRAQRRREQKEAEEKLKAEELKKKEERDERRREEIRLQKSPARTPSRVVSPARVPRVVPNAQPRSASKVLFPTTPGRVPSKIARIVEADGETSREPTMNTPSRENRRKPFPRKAPTADGSNDGLRVGSTRGETELENKEEQEDNQDWFAKHRERLRLEQDRFTKLNEDRYVEFIKMEVDDVEEEVNLEEELRHMPHGQERKEEQQKENKEEEQRLTEEEERRKRKEHEEAFIREQQRLEQLEAERKKEEERRQKEEQKKLLEEQQKRIIEEEKRLREEAEAEKKEKQRIEKEEAMFRLNVSSSAELHNRHLDNVSMNASHIHNKSSSHHSSYEMTPDKKYKAATNNNYNIDDLSSGDETDEEDAPRKKVPTWAEGAEFRLTIEMQSKKLASGGFDPELYFGEIETPDLVLIFGDKKRYPRRGSSGIWESPIGKPRQGVGAYQNRLNKRY